MTPKSNHLGGFTLLRGPLQPGQCPACAVVHAPEQPHNQQSLFWLYHFMELHGRWPTWADALAHCTPEIRAHWVRELAKHGIEVPPAAEGSPANTEGAS
jgi:hypothetical protein